MPSVILIQGSLSPTSKTALLVKEAERSLKRCEVDFATVDLRSLDLQFCDGRNLREYNETIQTAYDLLNSAKGFIFGMPVYCWSVSGPLKNWIDITAGAMENKVAGLLCNAGGNRSFLASSDLIKILFYEANVMTVHPVVYSSSEAFENGLLIDDRVVSKIDEMVRALVRQLKIP